MDAMFSRREREYLQRIVGTSGAPSVLSGRWLSPGYRRKLQYTIRRKVVEATSDWELYLSAAQQDPRVRLMPSSEGSGPVPLYTDPFIRVVRGARAALRRPRKRESPSLTGR